MGRKARQSAKFDLINSNRDDKKDTEHVTFSCDRRLSRAARSIVYKHLHVWQTHQGRKQHGLESDIADNVWDLLDQVYTLLPIEELDIGNCLLIPDRDMLQPHERQTKRLQASYIKNSAIPGYTKYENWHQCGFCGKMFVTSYYLDIHLESKHLDSLVGDVCPAHEWCAFLSWNACQDQAISNEPYYGRGSNHKAIKREYVNVAHSRQCVEEDMKMVQDECRRQLQTCFGRSEITEYLEHVVCEPISCHSRLHDLMHGTIDAAADWYNDWRYWSSHHHTNGGYTVAVLIAGLIVYICWWFKYQADQQHATLPNTDTAHTLHSSATKKTE